MERWQGNSKAVGCWAHCLWDCTMESEEHEEVLDMSQLEAISAGDIRRLAVGVGGNWQQEMRREEEEEHKAVCSLVEVVLVEARTGIE